MKKINRFFWGGVGVVAIESYISSSSATFYYWLFYLMTIKINIENIHNKIKCKIKPVPSS